MVVMPIQRADRRHALLVCLGPEHSRNNHIADCCRSPVLQTLP